MSYPLCQWCEQRGATRSSASGKDVFTLLCESCFRNQFPAQYARYPKMFNAGTYTYTTPNVPEEE